MKVGLRVDVDTLRGTRDGVPSLLRALGARDVRASFFCSVGPDNMGRHLWRLMRPAFLAKMLRSSAPSLYGWDILLRGTFWPGQSIARHAGDAIRAAAEAGHEIGLHAWDHHAWQMKLERWSAAEVEAILARGLETLTELTGATPRALAAPGWRCTDRVLLAEERFQLDYASDCRGDRVFRPVVEGRELAHVQVPATLPTYDELVGRECDAAGYGAWILDHLRPEGLNVFTIHAEVEGGVLAGEFERLLDDARERGVEFVPLRELVDLAEVRPGRIEQRVIDGREGALACLAAEERRWSAA